MIERRALETCLVGVLGGTFEVVALRPLKGGDLGGDDPARARRMAGAVISVGPKTPVLDARQLMVKTRADLEGHSRARRHASAGNAELVVMTEPRHQHVLVVEDELDMVATYERLLRRQGVRMVSARSRDEGLAALETSTPDLLISDIRLPDGNGLDMVRRARGLPNPPSVIVVTGLAAVSTRDAAMAAGATAFLTKPFSTEAFNGNGSPASHLRDLPPGRRRSGTSLCPTRKAGRV